MCRGQTRDETRGRGRRGRKKERYAGRCAFQTRTQHHRRVGNKSSTASRKPKDPKTQRPPESPQALIRATTLPMQHGPAECAERYEQYGEALGERLPIQILADVCPHALAQALRVLARETVLAADHAAIEDVNVPLVDDAPQARAWAAAVVVVAVVVVAFPVRMRAAVPTISAIGSRDTKWTALRYPRVQELYALCLYVSMFSSLFTQTLWDIICWGLLPPISKYVQDPGFQIFQALPGCLAKLARRPEVSKTGQDAKMAPRRAPQGPRGLQDNPKALHDAQDPKMTPKRPKWSQRNPKNAPNESQGRRPKAQGQHIPESFAFLCAFSAFFSCSRSPPRQPASRPKKPPSPKEGLRRPPGRAGGLLSRVPQRLARAVHQSSVPSGRALGPWERGDSRS